MIKIKVGRRRDNDRLSNYKNKILTVKPVLQLGALPFISTLVTSSSWLHILRSFSYIF